MSSIPPTLPFDVAQTYGVRAPLTVRPLAKAPAAAQTQAVTQTQTQAQTQPIGRIERADQADLSKVTSGIGRLLAARVEQPAFEGVSAPSAPVTQPTTDAMAFYHHPADRNAAATGVDLGRSLDISG